MKVDAFLSRLDKVRAAGADSWVACCPAHVDKHPSLTIRELPDETVLVHCFAGCSVDQILDSVGMEFDALFPDKPTKDRRPIRRPFPAEAVLAVLAFEAQVVLICANDLAAGRELNDEARKRLSVAAMRIARAKEVASG